VDPINPDVNSICEDAEGALSRKGLKIVLEAASSSAVGLALLLGAAPPAEAARQSAAQPSNARQPLVSERLAAIREAVSEIAEAETAVADPVNNLRLAWGNWGNAGWGRPWSNWGWGHPWGNHYRPWNNWNNWRNGWNNWRNHWRNW
jgi:rSAM-associated Gly-rich repeat protein